MKLYHLDSLPALGGHEWIFDTAGRTREMLPAAMAVGFLEFTFAVVVLGYHLHWYVKTRGYEPLTGIFAGSFMVLFFFAAVYVTGEHFHVAHVQVRMGDAGMLINTETRLHGAGTAGPQPNIAPRVIFLPYTDIEWARQTDEKYLYPYPDYGAPAKGTAVDDDALDFWTKTETAGCLDIRLKPEAATAALQAFGSDSDARKTTALLQGEGADLLFFTRPVRMVDERTIRIQWGKDTHPSVGAAMEALSGKIETKPAARIEYPAIAGLSKEPATWKKLTPSQRDDYMLFLVERNKIKAAKEMKAALVSWHDREEYLKDLFYRDVDTSLLTPAPPVQPSQESVINLLIERYLPAIAAILIVLACLLGWPIYRDVRDARQSPDWPAAQGTIVESQYGKDGSRRTLFIRYQYRVKGQEYESRRIAYQRTRSAADLLAVYPVGKEVVAHYYPDDPSRAVLEPGFKLLEFSPPQFLVEALGFVLMLLATMLFYGGVRAGTATRAAMQQTVPDQHPVIAEPSPAVQEQSRNDKPGSRMTPEEIFKVMTTGSEEDIKRLFETGADPNVKYPANGETPLMAVVKGNSLPLVTYLLRKGADPNSVSKKGATALVTAAMFGYTEIAVLLAEHGADVKYRDNKNNLSAAYYAAACGHLEIVRVLMSKGADIRIRANNGATALTDAIQNYYEAPDRWNVRVNIQEAVRFLLDNGIDPKTRDIDGKTALDYALQDKANDEVLSMLQGGSGTQADQI